MHDDDQHSFEDFAAQADERHRRQQRPRPACPHTTVMVAVRPWCADCGLLLPLVHPMARAVLRRLRGGKRAPELEGGR
jgi:hypothetical protein